MHQQHRIIMWSNFSSQHPGSIYTHSWIRSGSVSSLQVKNLEYSITNKHLERRKTNYSIGILPICGTWCIPVSDSVSFVGSVLVYILYTQADEKQSMRKSPSSPRKLNLTCSRWQVDPRMCAVTWNVLNIRVVSHFHLSFFTPSWMFKQLASNVPRRKDE